MKATSFILFLSIAALASATELLTTETFQEFLDSGKNGMVKFFQSWCGHCKRMKPDWDRLAEETSDSVLIADVDCGIEQELCDAQGVQGYPTIKFWVDGKERDYKQGRSFEELSEFVESISPPCEVGNEAKTCSEKALKYIEKWTAKTVEERKAETMRLEGYLFDEMKLELKKWVRERVIILKSFKEEPEL